KKVGVEKMKTKTKTFKALMTITSVATALSLSACGVADRVSRIGKGPELSAIENPYNQPNYQPVSLPMPPQDVTVAQPNSLWQASRQTFFKDQRANKVGDILTVMIDIDDTADLENKTERTRDGTETQGL